MGVQLQQAHSSVVPFASALLGQEVKRQKEEAAERAKKSKAPTSVLVAADLL